MKKQENSTNTIDLMQLLRICRKHIWALILWSVGLAIVGFAVADFVMPAKYTSSAQLLVNQKSNKTDPNAAYTTQQANMQLVTTYKDIVTSHVILKEASDRLANPVKVIKKAKSYVVSPSELGGNVSVSTQQQSQVFSISATTNTPDKAKAEANAVARVFRDRIPSIMNVNNVTIVAPATNGVQSSPNVKLFTLAGFVIGLVLSFAVVLIREMSNTTVRDDDFLVNELGLTNLGQIAHFHVSSSFKINKNKGKAKTTRKRRRV